MDVSNQALVAVGVLMALAGIVLAPLGVRMFGGVRTKHARGPIAKYLEWSVRVLPSQYLLATAIGLVGLGLLLIGVGAGWFEMG